MEVIDIMKNQKVRNLDKIITKTYSITDAAEAFEDLDKNAGSILKVTFKF